MSSTPLACMLESALPNVVMAIELNGRNWQNSGSIRVVFTT